MYLAPAFRNYSISLIEKIAIVNDEVASCEHSVSLTQPHVSTIPETEFDWRIIHSIIETGFVVAEIIVVCSYVRMPAIWGAVAYWQWGSVGC